MRENITISQFSERGVLVNFTQEFNQELVVLMTHMKEYLLKNSIKEILDINYTYNSLLIYYSSAIKDIYDCKITVEQALTALKANEKLASRKITLPVCYAEQFGIDLQYLSQKLQLDISEIIRLHATTEYLVCFLGFLPGFPYLENLPKQLHCLRKQTPRIKIEKGAVGIGGSQTGIYPQDSPGGWQIIGNCPIALFGTYWQDGALLKPTDKLLFEPISLKEHSIIKNDFQNGNYQLNVINVAAS